MSDTGLNSILGLRELEVTSDRAVFEWTIGPQHMQPYGLPHGPQPGMTEASIGKKETKELAVMVDTFYPLNLTSQALEYEKPEYMSSWMEGSGE